MRRKVCGRLITETRTPGRIGSADGPTETWQSTCELDTGHEGEHDWSVWHRVYA